MISADDKPDNAVQIKTDAAVQASGENMYEIAALGENGIATESMTQISSSGGADLSDLSIADQSAALAKMQVDNKDAMSEAERIDVENKKKEASSAFKAKKQHQE